MMKAGSCKSTDVTKLLQKQRRDSQWHRPMQDFVYGEDFCPFIEEHMHRVGNTAVSPRNFFSISCVAIAVENLTRRRRRKNCDASTYQSNNFGVSRKRFKPSTPGSTLSAACSGCYHTEAARLSAWSCLGRPQPAHRRVCGDTCPHLCDVTCGLL